MFVGLSQSKLGVELLGFDEYVWDVGIGEMFDCRLMQ